MIDGHCHIWESWPYRPAVPDPASRASAEQLLFEMDRTGIAQAIVICASLPGNEANSDYAFAAAARHPGRFAVFPDLECKWSPDFRKPGAARRLADALDRWAFSGFTLYLSEEETGEWLLDAEGEAFFALAARHGLIASLSVMPHQIANVTAMARRHPSLPILLHHFAFLGPRSNTNLDTAAPVLAAADCPNIWIKYSGMGNVAAPDQEYPYAELRWITDRLAAAFGPARMVWGSDWPVSRRHMTYDQTISLLRRHGPFDGEDLAAVLGGNMQRLLDGAR